MPILQMGKLEGQRDGSLSPQAPSARPLSSKSWWSSPWSWVVTQGPQEGAEGRPPTASMPPPTRLAWGLPPTLAPASPSYLKIIRLLGRRATQTDAELSIISSGGLDGE